MGTNKHYNGCLVWQTNGALSVYEHVDGTLSHRKRVWADLDDIRVTTMGETAGAPS